MATNWYISLAQLAERPGAVELSQVAQQVGQPIARPEILDAVLRGEETSQWPAEQVDVALTATKRIGDVVEETQTLIDGYLQQRGYSLPLANILPILTSWARSIARYKLHSHRISDERNDPIVRDYRDALRFLREVADGKFSLGLGDTQKPAGGSPQITGPGRTFSMDSLRDYGK